MCVCVRVYVCICVCVVWLRQYGLLASNPSPSLETVEKRFDGNLCRCTGYRSIFKAMHSFANPSSSFSSSPSTARLESKRGARHECEVGGGVRGEVKGEVKGEVRGGGGVVY